MQKMTKGQRSQKVHHHVSFVQKGRKVIQEQKAQLVTEGRLGQQVHKGRKVQKVTEGRRGQQVNKGQKVQLVTEGRLGHIFAIDISCSISPDTPNHRQVGAAKTDDDVKQLIERVDKLEILVEQLSCQWTSWSPWSVGRCSSSCDGGTRRDRRTRKYTHCVSGTVTETRTMSCNTQKCMYCEWGSWTSWYAFEPCQLSCDQVGIRTRGTRYSFWGSTTKCIGSSFETRTTNCNTLPRYRVFLPELPPNCEQYRPTAYPYK
ncbi:unnamed protein product [Owenia fusiformis]|uniref:Uncharacterized protein n=1 Tax=Owenia fusiformis TaxID=6347 RepID=A0A8S4PV56_OWEFU|nr:unnamed protein product [Owenia fusiformis]